MKLVRRACSSADGIIAELVMHTTVSGGHGCIACASCGGLAVTAFTRDGATVDAPSTAYGVCAACAAGLKSETTHSQTASRIDASLDGGGFEIVDCDTDPEAN